MRILVISNFYPPAHIGGYELECARVVEHLRTSHDVLVVTSRRGARRVPPESHVRRLLPYDSARKRDSLMAPLAAVAAARTTRRVVRSYRPDLIYVWNGTRIPQTAIRIATQSGAPVAYRVCEHWFGQLYSSDLFMRHLFPGDRGFRRAWAALVRLANRHPALRLDVEAAAPASISWVTDALRRQTPHPATVRPLLERTVHWGVEQRAALDRAPSSEPSFAFVGRLIPQKGPDIALSALAALERDGMRARLVLVGPADERYRRELVDLARKLRVDERVRFTGSLAREEVEAVLREVHAVVVPSRWEEPAGLVPVEAAALGVPVVAARSGGIPEMLAEDEHAVFFDVEDAEACARALARVVGEHAETTARVKRARARAAELSLTAYHAATETFLSDTLNAYADKASAMSPAIVSTE